MKTKITTASIRIALAYQYSTFEVAINLENPDGILKSEIALAQIDCQSLANDAVTAYKALPNPDLKIAIKNAENQIKQIKEMAENKKPEKEVDPKEIEAIANLPEYKPKKQITGKSANELLGKPKTKVSQMKVPNDISGLGADD